MEEFDYKNKEVPKLTDEFKDKFTVFIKGTSAIKLQGLVAFAHIKGMWKFHTEIIQYPNKDNDWTAICKTVVGGYDWDPIDKKIIRVEYSDIADASSKNCNPMVSAAYIRMASTRSQGRALRKYTNIDLVTSDELNENIVDSETKPITVDRINTIKKIIVTKFYDYPYVQWVCSTLFNKSNMNTLTNSEADTLIKVLTHCMTLTDKQNKELEQKRAEQQKNQLQN